MIVLQPIQPMQPMQPMPPEQTASWIGLLTMRGLFTQEK
jgi:hypothetical protein